MFNGATNALERLPSSLLSNTKSSMLDCTNDNPGEAAQLEVSFAVDDATGATQPSVCSTGSLSQFSGVLRPIEKVFQLRQVQW